MGSNYASADTAYADTYLRQNYAWDDGARQASVSLTNRDGASYSSYNYDLKDQLVGVNITGGTRPRNISFENDDNGQIITRREADYVYNQNDPSQRSYYFGGKSIGTIGNDGTGNVSYATSIASRIATPGTGAFRGGATSASIFADFDQNYAAINGTSQSDTAGSYSVQGGESLAQIAAAIWGDAALWYKLAEANGLSGGEPLAAGRTLIVPSNVTRNHNNASTAKAYDPAEAIGNTSPNTPKPPKKNNCGTVGILLLAVVAIAVTAITAGAAVAALGQAPGIISGLGSLAAGKLGAVGVAVGAGAAATGSIVSQVVGVATGIQDKFSWKGVALAAIAGGVGGAIGATGVVGKIGGSAFVRGAVSGVLNSALGQGIGIATGLQSKFSFAAVAAAGVAGGVGGRLGSRTTSLESSLTPGNIASHLAVGGASLLASAATRSAIEGTNFESNITAGLPDVLAQTLVDVATGAVGNRNTGAAKSDGGGEGRSDVVASTARRSFQLANRSGFAGIQNHGSEPGREIYDRAGNDESSEGEIVVTADRHFSYDLNQLNDREFNNFERLAAKRQWSRAQYHQSVHRFVQYPLQSDGRRYYRGPSNVTVWDLAGSALTGAKNTVVGAFGVLKTGVELGSFNRKTREAAQGRVVEFGAQVINGNIPRRVYGGFANAFDAAIVRDDLRPAAEGLGGLAVGGVAARSAGVSRSVGGVGAAESNIARGLRGTSVVSPARAESFLVKNGFSPADAKDFIGSFDGPITARIVRPGEDFLRYTGNPTSTGSFLTKSRFSNPASAVDGLYLSPYGNPATYVQTVTSSGRSIVLEGAIKNGGSGVGQTVIHNRGAFTFGVGQGF